MNLGENNEPLNHGRQRQSTAAASENHEEAAEEMISYALILMLALALNIQDRKMFALALVVGAGIFMPIPAPLFYLVCMLVELLVALLALRIDAQASALIVRMSAMLFVFHGLGWALDGYPMASPYHAAVKFLEHAELALCCLFSRPILARCIHV